MSEDPTGPFKTHANYIRSFAYLVDPEARDAQPTYDVLANRIVGSGLLAVGPDPANVDLEQVHRSLSNAWGTELLLSLGHSVIRENELVALSNNWSVVQAYYATYHAVQSYAVTKRFPRPDSHPKTQNQYFSLWTQRPITLAPWTLGVGHNANFNLPPGIVVHAQRHPWSRCDGDTCWDISCKALHTTREDAVAEALERKREAKRRARRQDWFRVQRERQEAGRRLRRGDPPNTRPTLTPAEKREIRESVRPATLMDYLYRLRVKTNYVDSNMFTDGPEVAADSWRVRNDISVITAGTMLLHEIAIGRQIGYETVLPWARDWVSRNSPVNASYGLAARLPALEGAP